MHSIEKYQWLRNENLLKIKIKYEKPSTTTSNFRTMRGQPNMAFINRTIQNIYAKIQRRFNDTKGKEMCYLAIRLHLTLHKAILFD